MTPRAAPGQIFFGKGIDKLELMCYNVGTTKRKEMNDMEIKCPYCGEIFDFDDEFTNFTDEGDYVSAWAVVGCKCGEALRVEANFEWDGKIKVR